MKTLLNLSLLAALVSLVAGCATVRSYTAKDAIGKGPEETAYIFCDSQTNHTVLRGLNDSINISKVDGKSTLDGGAVLVDNNPYANNVRVLPGRHYLVLNYTCGNTYASGEVWLDCEAGKTYVIRNAMQKRFLGGYITFWAEEQDTGKLVGGLPGGEPESSPTPSVPATPPKTEALVPKS